MKLRFGILMLLLSFLSLTLVNCKGSGSGGDTVTDDTPNETENPTGDDTAGDDDTTSEFADVDGDGFTTETDCNDSDATIYPEATEKVGDGVDQNCDLTEVCYVDSDGDGQRPVDPTYTVASLDLDCADAGEATATAVNSDCNDSQSSVYLGASEVWYNGQDDDCLGGSDNDQDGDGEDAIAQGGVDCNDTDATIFTTAQDKIIGGVFTNKNCDEKFDIALSEVTQSFLGEAEGDLLGGSQAGLSAGDVNHDGCDDFLIASYNYGDLKGRVYLMYGRGDSCSLQGAYPALESADVIFEGENDNDQFGDAVSMAGDVNEDGCEDMLMGASLADSFAGKAYLVLGRGASCQFSGSYVSLKLATSADGVYRMNGASGYMLGKALTKLGDIDSDGCGDFMLGAPGYAPTGDSEGVVYVVQGQGVNCSSNLDYESFDLNLTTNPSALNANSYKSVGYIAIDGQKPNGNFGYVLSYLGDADHDGINDLALSEPLYDNKGSFRVILGGSDASSIDFTTYFMDQLGEDGDLLGSQYLGIGDVDLDNQNDVLLTSGGYSANLGKVDLFSAASTKFLGTVASTSFGLELAGGKDFNSDGCSDFSVSNSALTVAGLSQAGQIYLHFGRDDSYAYEGDYLATEESLVTFLGTQSQGEAGLSVTFGNFNGDAYGDILISESGYSDSVSNRGKVYLIFGHAF